nr:nicotinate-nucleotide--dimethylbenzimidazole phosphoribosyltransferase [Synergistaceae bacterium]
PKSLGTLENIAVRLAGITGKSRNAITRKVICLFGSDHGVYSEGVCSSPQDFTRKLMQVYADSQNGGINILARQAGAELRIYDLGVKGLAPHKNIITQKFMPSGTNNLLRERAMPPEITEKVILWGIELVRELKAQGVDLIGTGEVGMGNTATAAACIMAVLGRCGDENLIGRGGGLTDEAFNKKQKIIKDALVFHKLNNLDFKDNLKDCLEILSCVGGLDIAAMTGVFLGAAAFKIPVVIDGVISIAAALLAAKISEHAKDYMIASHCSAEPAYVAAAEELKLTPMLNLGMRLGEGTGCPLAMQIVDDALAIMNNMGTFESVMLESEYRKILKF